MDPGLLDHRHKRLLRGASRLEETRKVAPLAQLGNLEIERPEPRVEGPLAIAVALCRPLIVALVAARADPAIDVVGHKPLQHLLGQVLLEIAASTLQQSVQQWHGVIGHRGSPVRVASRNPILTRGTVATQGRRRHSLHHR